MKTFRLPLVLYLIIASIQPLQLISVAESIRISAYELTKLFSFELIQQSGAATLAKEAYQNFAVDLLDSTLLLQEKQGPHSKSDNGMSPLNLAFFLAVLHENTWDISTTGIEEVLHLKENQIHEIFKEIANRLANNNTYANLSSNIYTKQKDFITPKNVDELKTRVIYIDENDAKLNEIKARVKELISRYPGRFRDVTLNKNTEGIITNTLHFDSEWMYPFSPIGKKSFIKKCRKLEFIEATGDFGARFLENYTAVRIPLKDAGKSLVLIKPIGDQSIPRFVHDNFKEFLKGAEVWRGNSNGLLAKIQIPSFKYSQFNEISKPLAVLGLREPFCGNETKTSNTLDSILQTIYVGASESRFEVAVATGSTLSAKNHFNKICDISPKKVRELNAEPREWTLTTNVTMAYNSSKDISKQVIREISRQKRGKDDSVVVFDTPFLWYFQDENLGMGPLLVGTIETGMIQDIHTEESDYVKLTTALIAGAFLTTGVVLATVFTVAALTTALLTAAAVTAFMLTAIVASNFLR